VRLTVNGRTHEQKTEVREDPRIDIAAADRKVWHDTLMEAAGLIREFAPVHERVQKSEATDAAGADRKRQSRELLSRLTGLYGDIGRSTARPTADQLTRLQFYREMMQKLRR
jgi:hypothetical protein